MHHFSAFGLDQRWENLYFGNCTPEDLENVTDILNKELIVCAQGHSTIEYGKTSSLPKEETFSDSKIYFAIHKNRQFSLHAEAASEIVHGRYLKYTKSYQYIDFFFLQISNPVTAPVTFNIGSINNLFGINHMVDSPFIENTTNQDMWHSKLQGALIRINTTERHTLELGSGIDKGQNKFYSTLRYGISHPIWYRSKFVFSLLLNEDYERKVGLALINNAPNGTYTTFEWVREFLDKNGFLSSFKQVIRFTITGQKKNQRQVEFLFEDYRKQYRIGALIQKIYLSDYVNLSYGLSYQTFSRSLQRKNTWSFTIGLTGHI